MFLYFQPPFVPKISRQGPFIAVLFDPRTSEEVAKGISFGIQKENS